MRNPVLISHLNPDNHEWAKKRAEKITEETGHRTTMSSIVDLSLARYRQECEDEEAIDKAKSDKEPWLREKGAN